MSSLAAIQSPGWRASPLSSQWKPSGLLGQANQSSVSAGSVVSGALQKTPQGVPTGADQADKGAEISGQTSPVVQKPADGQQARLPEVKPMTKPHGGPWWDGYDSPQAMNAEMEKYAAYEKQQPELRAEFVKQAGGEAAVKKMFGGTFVEEGFQPTISRLPDGRLIMQGPSHPELGAGHQFTADGRIYQPTQTEGGHWDNPEYITTGYSLQDPRPKKGSEYGLKTDKEVWRWESFDNDGKSLGYTHELADNSLFSGWIKGVLSTPIAAPLLGGLGNFLAPSIASATGLGAAASKVAASGLIGGVTGAASGAGFGRGALMGAAGGAVSAYNPAAQMGVSSGWQTPVNNVIKAGAGAAIRGDSVKDAVVGSVLNPVNLLKLPGWRSAEGSA